MPQQDVSLAVTAAARRPLSGRVGLVAAALVVLGEGSWLVSGLPGAALVSDLGAVVVASWAALACVRAARRHPLSLRRFWALLTLTMALAAVGRIVWTIERLGGHGLPHTPLVGGLFAAGIVTGTAALLCALAAPRGLVGQARVLLDGVIVGLALIPIGWMVVFRDIASADLADPLRTFGLLYPMVDLMQLAILLAVAGPARPMWRALTLIGVSLAVRATTDAIYVSLVAHHSYVPGHPIDVWWPLSYLLIGAATGYRRRPAGTTGRSPPSRRCRRGGGSPCRTCRWAGRSSPWCSPGGPPGRPHI